MELQITEIDNNINNEFKNSKLNKEINSNKKINKKSDTDQTNNNNTDEITKKQLTITKKQNNKKKNVSDKNIEKVCQYQKMELREHIEKLPDAYVGSMTHDNITRYVVNNKNSDIDDDLEFKIEENTVESKMRKETKGFEEITFKTVPALLSIIEEIIINAFDNYNRVKQRKNKGNKHLQEVTYIKINFNRKEGIISIENDGEGIEIAKHPKEKIWIPDLIFGHLLTSGNYNLKEEKITGGKNGYGAKLTNIFSSLFIVETVDSNNQLYYKQVYENNMRLKHEPEISKSLNKSYTRITFKPDLRKFNLPCMSLELYSYIEKRAYDLYVCSKGNVNIYFNDELLPVKSFDDYIRMYLYKHEETKYVSYKVNDRWEIAACLSPEYTFKQVSHVNGINTSRGGKHVDYVVKQICKKLVEVIKKKRKITVKESFIRDNLMVFVNSTIVNPSFDSQTKETLTTNLKDFGSECHVNDSFINLLSDTGIMDRAITLNTFREAQLVKKTENKKNQKNINIDKLEDAKYAGSRRGSECTLILTEGDSAKAMAVSGLSVIPEGRCFYGVYPLKGKMLNTRDKSDLEISKNKEIADIKKIIGLETNKIYTSVDQLRYGKIMIMTDQDDDGTHIKGLILNFLTKWSSLIKIDGFVTSLLTPILKIWKGNKKQNSISFYNMHDFNKWISENGSLAGYNIKYYKGLGTSTPQEGKEYFKNFNIKHYKWDKNADDNIDKAFNKERSDDRKNWLKYYNKHTALDSSEKVIKLSDFINNELIIFSNTDNARSIPNLMDGLKISQRKILWCSFKRKLTKEIRVAQLGGYVSENGSYHHGEVSLYGTIVNMAQNYVGSNNINLLVPEGQFGTRLKGGKDSAQSRYIHTYLSNISYKLFNKLDNSLYEYTMDDGKHIEPEFYTPILPMILVNGSEGIGTGWSCHIPPFNPKDIIKNLKHMMKYPESEPEDLIPWFRGFKGNVIKLSKNRWMTRGIYKIIDQKTILISELPIGTWTDNYKILLDSFLTTSKIKGNDKSTTVLNKVISEKGLKLIKDYTNNSTDSKVSFEIKVHPDVMDHLFNGVDNNKLTYFERIFKLVSTITCEKTLNLYNENGNLQSFTSCNEILKNYFRVRLHFYKKRKIDLINKLNLELLDIGVKVKFILDIINKKIKINNTNKNTIILKLIELEYPIMYDGKLIKQDELIEHMKKELNLIDKYGEDHYIKDTEKLSKKLLANKSKIDDIIQKRDLSKYDYDYLIKMPIYNLTKDKVEELQNDKLKLEKKLNLLSETSIENLWLNDINEFELEYKKFNNEYLKYMGYLEDETQVKKKSVNFKNVKRKDIVQFITTNTDIDIDNIIINDNNEIEKSEENNNKEKKTKKKTTNNKSKSSSK